MPISPRSLAAMMLTEIGHAPRDMPCTVCGDIIVSRSSQRLYCKPCAYKTRYARRKAKREAVQNGKAG